MEYHWLNRDGNKRAIMIFAGWGCHAAIFTGLTKPGYDIVVLWDYRNESFDSSIMAGYEEIFLIAWSMGVFEAQRVLSAADLPIYGKLAVNGTSQPISDSFGIPEDIFNGTLSGLNGATLKKFHIRMCGGMRRYEEVKESLSLRPLGELIEELRLIGERAAQPLVGEWHWSRAIVGAKDAIFPPANQLNSWAAIAADLCGDMYHLPDWQYLLDNYVADKELIARRFKRSQDSYNESGTVQAQVAQRLFSLWDPGAAGLPSCGVDLLEVGAGTGLFTSLYAPALNIRSLTLWDIAGVPPGLSDALGAKIEMVDAELAITSVEGDSLDYIVSSSTMQWFNSVAAFVDNCHRVLKSGGKLVVSTYGPDTYAELRSLGLRLPSYLTEEALLAIFDNRKWQVVKHFSEQIALKFDSPREVFAHIKSTGVNAIHRQGRSVGEIRRMMREYPRCELSGDACLTYQPIYIVAKKR